MTLNNTRINSRCRRVKTGHAHGARWTSVFGHYSVFGLFGQFVLFGIRSLFVFFCGDAKNELEYRGLNVKGSTEAVYRSSHAHMYTSPFLVVTPHHVDIINASLNNRTQRDVMVSSLWIFQHHGVRKDQKHGLRSTFGWILRMGMPPSCKSLTYKSPDNINPA